MNFRKVLVAPLCDVPWEHAKDELARLFLAWGLAAVMHWAEYLGFLFDPTCDEQIWRRASEQIAHHSGL